jgi:hypothetical protein
MMSLAGTLPPRHHPFALELCQQSPASAPDDPDASAALDPPPFTCRSEPIRGQPPHREDQLVAGDDVLQSGAAITEALLSRIIASFFGTRAARLTLAG